MQASRFYFDSRISLRGCNFTALIGDQHLPEGRFFKTVSFQLVQGGLKIIPLP
jgi:hypothetical protein